MKYLQFLIVFVFITIFPISSFGITKHAVILVMDGARYTETFGDSTRANIPKISALASEGTLLSNFYTAKTGSIAESWTETNPGHARITTGTYQNISNDGTQLPTQPSIFQHYRKQTSAPATKAWVICSKDKLKILANSSATGWYNQYQPSMNCGVNGDGTGGYRADNLTHAIVKQKLTSDRPALMIINYAGPDSKGHANDWNGYLAAIKEVDGYADDLWKTIQADDSLKNTTALFIVNDHGRHTNNWTSHGDNCMGCRHVMCVILGPDIKSGFIDTITREQIDLAPTIANMMGFAIPTATGIVMNEIFKPITFVRRDNKTSYFSIMLEKITVTLGNNRNIMFSHLPSDVTKIEIFNGLGHRVANVAVDPLLKTAVWNTITTSGANVASGHYICKVTSTHIGTVLVPANVPW